MEIHTETRNITPRHKRIIDFAKHNDINESLWYPKAAWLFKVNESEKDLIFDSQQQELICTADWLAFPIRDGIPVMLESEARDVAVLEREKYH